MSFEARRGRVVEFIEEYHDGCWNLQSADANGLVERVAENVMAFYNIKPVSTSRTMYVLAVREALELGQLKWRTAYGLDNMSLMICTREFVEGLSE